MNAGRERWLLVVDPRGTIIAVGGAAPARWRGMPIMDLAAELPAVAAEARKLVASLERGRDLARAVVDGADVEVEIVGMAAIGVARATCDLRAIVERAAAPFHSQADLKDVALVVRCGSEPVSVHADEPKIVWIVATLIGNALRYARQGTRRLPGGAIAVTVDRAPGHAVVTVKDDGPGIDPARLRSLFAGDAASAIALRMARDVAIAHGGSLDVVSSIDALDHGTVVTLTIPLSG